MSPCVDTAHDNELVLLTLLRLGVEKLDISHRSETLESLHERDEGLVIVALVSRPNLQDMGVAHLASVE